MKAADEFVRNNFHTVMGIKQDGRELDSEWEARKLRLWERKILSTGFTTKEVVKGGSRRRQGSRIFFFF